MRQKALVPPALMLVTVFTFAPADTAAVEPSLQAVRSHLEATRYGAAEREARELLRRLEVEQGPGASAMAQAADLLAQALWWRGKVRDGEALRLSESAVAIVQRQRGADSLELVPLLRNLARTHYTMARYTEQVDTLARAVAIVEKASGPDSDLLGELLLDLGRAERWRGNGLAAATALGRALEVLERTRDAADPALLACILNHHFVSEGRLPERLEPRFAAALAGLERRWGHDHPVVADFLVEYMELLQCRGRHPEARAVLERAVAIYRSVLGERHPAQLMAVTYLGVEVQALGDLQGAAEVWRRGAEALSATLGPDHPEIATLLGNVGESLAERGEYAEARGLFEQSLASFERAFGPDDTMVGIALVSLAELQQAMGDFREARAGYERALTIHEGKLGPNHHKTAWVLHCLGSMLVDLGDDRGALPLLERAVTALDRSFGSGGLPSIPTRVQLARVLVTLGELERAGETLRTALVGAEAGAGADSLYAARCRLALGELELRAGATAAGTARIAGALAVLERRLGADHPEVASAYLTLARCRLALGARGEALEQALHAEALGREHLRLCARSLSEREALRYALTRPSGLAIALGLAASGLDDAGRKGVLDAVVRSRGLVLEEMASRHREMGGEAAGAPAATLAAARTRLANLAMRGPDRGREDGYVKRVEKARREKEAAERALAAKSTAFRAILKRSTAGLAEVSAALQSNEALVSYVRYASAGTVRYAAFVVRPGAAPPVAIDLGAGRAVETEVERWRAEVGVGPLVAGRSRDEATSAYRDAGAALRSRIWDPIALHLTGARRVLVVPDGELHRASLAALPTGSGGYLIEDGFLIETLVAERDLVSRPGPARRGEGALVLGGPDFDRAEMPERVAARMAIAEQRPASPYRGSRSGCPTLGSMRFAPLPSAREEASRVTAAVPGGAPARVLSLTGPQASEAAFKLEAPGRRVLHLATHGFFLGGSCATTLGARGVGGLTTEPLGEQWVEALESPLLLSGLALAGANRRGGAGPEEEDGILTAEEIAALDLAGVELAVLSGCDTGLGEVQAGEGVLGLQRAFVMAGAGAVVMSLWPVDDAVAGAWMERFYGALSPPNADAATAARRASLDLLRRARARGECDHPFAWAPFVTVRGHR